MKTATVAVKVSFTEMDEVQKLIEAAAVLLSTLGERGEIKSYDREPANLWTAANALQMKIAEMRSFREVPPAGVEPAT